jgi:hypothetical protein
MISATSSGSFKKTISFLEFMKSGKIFSDLDRYGRVGVDALSRATPRDTGATAHSWVYTVERSAVRCAINWSNTHKHNGVNIAVIVQYGHGTGTGGYVQGRDYINPAMRPVFDKILEDIWRQVTNG